MILWRPRRASSAIALLLSLCAPLAGDWDASTGSARAAELATPTYHVDMWSDADPVLAGQEPSITFYVSTGVGSIAGEVALFDTTDADLEFVDVVELDVDASGQFGQATFVLEPMAPGTYMFEGDYLGSDTHEPAWADVELVVHEALVAGPVVINDGDSTTTSSIVSVDAPATGSLGIELSPDGAHWQSASGPGPYAIDLAAFGGGDGTYTVGARWIDQLGGTSEIQTDTIILDTLPPTGSIVIADGATYAGVQTTVDLVGVDLGTGVVEAQLSNDQLVWTTVANANDVAWTLDSACEPCRVWARWRDGAGHWSATASDLVSLDLTPPQISLARESFRTAAPTVTFTAGGSDGRSGLATLEASNDAAHFVSIPNGTTTTWSLIDPATGGLDADGPHTVTIRAIDHAGNVSTGAWSFTLDRVAPVVALAADRYATGSSVQVTAGATDATSGMATIELSNDGIHWATVLSLGGLIPRPTIGGSPIPWSLTDAATGGTNADGQHSIYARARDLAGNVSLRDITIILDRVVPVAGSPVLDVPGGASLAGTALPVRVSWLGSDATSGVARYEMERQVDGVWNSFASSLAGPSVVAGLAANHSYRFRVRAIDRAGNAGAWVTGPSLRLDGFQESSARITYRGTWRTGTAAAYWGGRDRYAAAAGATARFSITNKGFAWVAPVGPTRGRARVYVNGVLKQTVNLYSATAGQCRIIYSTVWSTSATRTIIIRVVGTAGHPRVDIDGIFVWR